MISENVIPLKELYNAKRRNVTLRNYVPIRH